MSSVVVIDNEYEPKNKVRFGVKSFENQYLSSFSLGSGQVTDTGRIKKIDLSELKEEEELISDMSISVFF